MANTSSKSKRNAYARKYYKENKKYREEKIEDRKQDAKANRKKENAYSKEYYWKNSEYRKYKRKYARNYKRTHASSGK